jgi:hypothetical protein
MLKAWNKKVRMTTATISACPITRRVSANPPLLCSRDGAEDVEQPLNEKANERVD